MVIRVASYNVRSMRDDTAALGRVITGLRADVLCVQEAPGSCAGAVNAGCWPPPGGWPWRRGGAVAESPCWSARGCGSCTARAAC
ncbi:endonuclease/exonuclease/phosphatase family protein [Streptosporangium lutulentum]